MADQKSAEPKTLEFRIEVTVGKTAATVTLTLKSTAVVADVQTKIVTDQPPRDDRQKPILSIHSRRIFTGKPSPYPSLTLPSSWPSIARRISTGHS